MSEEIRNDEFEVTETVETEDEKVGLGPMEYGVILGIGAAAVGAWELGKLGWRKTEKPRRKVKDFVAGIFKKDKGNVDETPDHEGSSEKVPEDSEKKKSDKKSSKK